MEIDYDALAVGLLDMFDEGERAVMAFGMIPASKFYPFMKMMWEEMAKKQNGQVPSKETKETVEHEMSLALYRNAKMVV